MTFFKHTLFAIGLLCLGIVQAWATPKSNLNKHYSALVTVSWVGGTAGFETDWNTGTNWSTGNVPGSSDNVSINGSLTHYPVLNNNTAIQSLDVQSGASLTINAGRTLTISGAGTSLSLSSSGTINNNGTITITATSDAFQLNGSGGFFNGTLNVTTTGNYGIKIGGSAFLQNEISGIINSTGSSGSLFFSGNNTPVEMVKNYGRMNLTKQIEKYSDTFHNYPCGVVTLTSGEVYNNGGQIINEGFFSAPANLNGNAANFINDGIVYVSGSASYTNNKIRIFNNAASTGIFEFAAGNDLTVSGIYKDNTVTALAGGYNQASNTFTHFGLSAGSQTLYAKITRPGGTCPQIVPFTFEVTTASTFTTHPTNQTVCPGSPAVFTVVIANAASYQWQINAGGGWTNLAASSPHSNVTTATLNISNVDGLNGYQYRCVATGAGGVSVTSNAATLTIGAGGGSNPMGTLTWMGGVDTDWNTPCNWSPASVPTATNVVVIPGGTPNQPTIGTAAVAQSVEVQAGAVLLINTTKSLTINGSRTVSSTTSGFYNIGTVHNNGQLILGNTGSIGDVGLLNMGTFNNNLGAEITIDRATVEGLANNTGGVFTNAAKIIIGVNASVGANGLTNRATFNNNSDGEITIDNITVAGLFSKQNTPSFPTATFTNAGKITISNSRTAVNGLYNGDGSTFNNNEGGEITIVRAITDLRNDVGGIFNNTAKIIMGTTRSDISNGLENIATFTNNTGGEIIIEHTTLYGIISKKNSPSDPVVTFTNAGKITIGATTPQVEGLYNGNGAIFNNNAGGEINIDRVAFRGLRNDAGGTFNNAAILSIGATPSGGAFGLQNQATFNNNTGGEIKIDNLTDTGLWNQVGTFTNAAKITIGAMASVGTYGIKNEGTINNNACGKLIVASGIVQNNASKTIANEGLVQITDNLENNGTFTNNGVLKYGFLAGSVTNSTNPSLIVNNVPAPIFTYGTAMFDGIINGIFKDSLATLSAGTFTAPNTFVPSGLPGGSQILYAKITPAGGACSYAVPFRFVIVQGVYTWTGALSKEWNTPGNWLVGGSVPSVAPTFGSTLGNHTLIPVVANGNYPEVSAASGALSVIIAANASLTVKSTGNLKIVGSDLDGVTNAGTFTNNGTVLIDSSYNDGFVNQTGASLINTNALTIQMGTGNRLENYGSINNSGTFTVGGGLATAILNHPGATIINTSTFEVGGGLTGGMLNQGTVDNSAQMTFNGGVFETLFINQETVKNRPDATMTINNHKALLFDNQKLVENEGTFNVKNGGNRGFVSRAGATLRNKAGAVFEVNATQKTIFTNSGYIENYHTFNTSRQYRFLSIQHLYGRNS